MFNPKMRVLMNVNATVQEWIEELQKLPPETPISICGAYNGYIHVETDENDHPTGVTIDCEPLDEEYPEDAFDDDDEEGEEINDEEPDEDLARDLAYGTYPEAKLRSMSDDELSQACLSSKVLGERAAAIVMARVTEIRERRARGEGLTTNDIIGQLKEYPGIPVKGDFRVVYDDGTDHVDHIQLGDDDED